MSDFPIDEAIRTLARYGVEAGFLVPTETALRKSIIDAHEGMRSFLRRSGIHDFATQPQGPSDKVLVKAHFVTDMATRPTQVSLYRPVTKEGDPRVWVYGLKERAMPGNLIALIARAGELYVINVSNAAVWSTVDRTNSPLNRLLVSLSGPNQIETELLEKLRAIAEKGYVPSLRSGDTGVGFTLETMLGIRANSARTPDYKGIELKASRRIPRSTRPGRVTLFSQVPSWKESALENALRVLATYGYRDGSGERRLYCTTGLRPNPQGLYMAVDNSGSVHCLSNVSAGGERVVQWKLSMLEDRLAEKHASTFWVKADVVTSPTGEERFHYREVIHTKSPLIANLAPLIDSGKITLDFTLKTLPSGAAKDHGYLFRMNTRDFDLLFPPATVHVLAQ